MEEDNKLKIILDLIDGKSVRLRETYFNKYYNDIYNQIVEYNSNISNLPFIEKIWHWVNDKPDYIKCQCGKDVMFNRNWLHGYKYGCSAKCTQNNPETKLKRKNTTIEKYGVDNIAKLEESKVKVENTNMVRYGCKSSFQNTEVREKWTKNIQSKYGVDHVFQLESVKEKSKKTTMGLYGKEHFVQTKEYLLKTKKTNLEKYGVEWYSQVEGYMDIIKTSNLEKYGVEWYTQTDEFKQFMLDNKDIIQEKTKITNLERYGVEWYSQTDEFKKLLSIFQSTVNMDELIKKQKNTNLLRYGVEWYTQTSEYRNKSISTSLEKYGKEYYSQSENFKTNLILTGRLIKLGSVQRDLYTTKLKSLSFDIIKRDNKFITLRSDKCGHEFTINSCTLYYRYSNNMDCCLVCSPINSGQSMMEKNLITWLEGLNIRIETKNRTICSPQEIDIYLPDYNLAIEFNGLYWHSSEYKNSSYHLDKTKICNKNGIHLMHIWEDDWCFKTDIVKSMILNKIKKISNRIFARKCVIGLVSPSDKSNFLNDNHVQGSCNSSINIGLFYNKELVSLMIFGSSRNNTGDNVELLRFCNKINTNIVGSASKLFNYFITKYKFNSITSFADISVFTGDIYKLLGFDFIHRTGLNYWWIIDDIRKHKSNYSKKKLVKRGA
jgi:hypothetical protein